MNQHSLTAHHHPHNRKIDMTAGTLRGMGDSKASLWFLIVSCIANILLALAFVVGLHMDAGGVALLRFKSGAIGVIEGMTLAYPGRQSEIGIFGQLGSAGIRNDALEHYCFKAGKDSRFEALLEQGKEDPSKHLSFARQYEDVIDAVKRGRPPIVTGQEGLQSVRIILGIYESSRKNEWVPIG